MSEIAKYSTLIVFVLGSLLSGALYYVDTQDEIAKLHMSMEVNRINVQLGSIKTLLERFNNEYKVDRDAAKGSPKG